MKLSQAKRSQAQSVRGSPRLEEEEKREAMPRKGYIAKREVAADPIYQSTLVTKFVNSMMWGGKKSTAQGIFYEAMTNLEPRAATRR